MCHCLTEMRIALKDRFADEHGLGCLTEQLPASEGGALHCQWRSRVLIRIKYADRKFMNIPALFCPFCGEKYNPDEPSTVEQSIQYVQKKKGDEITRLPR